MTRSGRLGHEGLLRMHEFFLGPSEEQGRGSGGRRLAAGSHVILTVPSAFVLPQTFPGVGGVASF